MVLLGVEGNDLVEIVLEVELENLTLLGMTHRDLKKPNSHSTRQINL